MIIAFVSSLVEFPGHEADSDHTKREDNSADEGCRGPVARARLRCRLNCGAGSRRRSRPEIETFNFRKVRKLFSYGETVDVVGAGVDL